MHYFFQENVKFDKYYILSKGFKYFQVKYPFLCIDLKTLSSSFDFKDQPQLYALCRFPSEIIEDLIYLVKKNIYIFYLFC